MIHFLIRLRLYYFALKEYFFDIFFHYIPTLTLIYACHHRRWYNITWYYYLSKYLNIQHTLPEKLFVRIDDRHFTYRFGEFNTLTKLSLKYELPAIEPIFMRKQFILKNNDELCAFDQSILDTYFENVLKRDHAILNMEEVFDCLNVPCNKIEFIDFSGDYYKFAENTSIYDLYDLFH